jgi:hypothetical protein
VLSSFAGKQLFSYPQLLAMSFTSAAIYVAALFICASGAEISCPNASCPAQWDSQPNENVDEDTRSIEDELAMIQVSIRQHKDGLPSESAMLEHGKEVGA